MKNILLVLFTLITFTSFSQVLRDSIVVKTPMFEIVYSEKLEQPKFIRYTVQCPNGTAARTGMDFYVDKTIKTLS